MLNYGTARAPALGGSGLEAGRQSCSEMLPNLKDEGIPAEHTLQPRASGPVCWLRMLKGEQRGSPLWKAKAEIPQQPLQGISATLPPCQGAHGHGLAPRSYRALALSSPTGAHSSHWILGLPDTGGFYLGVHFSTPTLTTSVRFELCLSFCKWLGGKVEISRRWKCPAVCSPKCRALNCERGTWQDW